jgi:hypothetical protein
MSDDNNNSNDQYLGDFFGVNFLALWRFGFSEQNPFLAIGELTCAERTGVPSQREQVSDAGDHPRREPIGPVD